MTGDLDARHPAGVDRRDPTTRPALRRWLLTGVAAVGFLQSRRSLAGRSPAGAGAVVRVAPFLSFFTLVTVAVVPPAAALYVVTSTAWSVVERAVLHR